tara:strand:+ start:90 stop:452 length:363 start_codon:yes stop_codon:yes gene_type:complete
MEAFSMSTVKVDTIQNSAGVEVFTAKAWVNFNGTGTPAANASGNLSSITDNGAGDYTITLTTAMSDANFAITLTAMDNGTYHARPSVDTLNRTSSTYRINSFGHTNLRLDTTNIYAAVHR